MHRNSSSLGDGALPPGHAGGGAAGTCSLQLRGDEERDTEVQRLYGELQGVWVLSESHSGGQGQASRQRGSRIKSILEVSTAGYLESQTPKSLRERCPSILPGPGGPGIRDFGERER